MKIRLFAFFFLFFSLFSFSSKAQNGDDENDADDENEHLDLGSLNNDGKIHHYVFDIRVNATVPKPMGNKAYRRSFLGVYEASLATNVYLYKGIFIGASAKNGMLKITENKIPNYNAQMEIDNVAGKLGGDLYLGERKRIIFSAALAIGQNWTHYYSFVRKDTKDPSKVLSIPLDNARFNTFFYEPEINLYFLVDNNMGIGATITYSLYNHTFDPFELYLNQWAPFDPGPTGNTSNLSFGLGFYYNFLEKKYKGE